MNNKILVIGGTGTIGSLVIEELQKKNANYVALVRSEEKAEALEAKGVPTVIGSVGEQGSIEHVFEGIDTVFLLTSPSNDMLELHKEVIDIAVKSGVRKIVRQSGEPAGYSEPTGLYILHNQADEYLKKSGLEHVILRPHYFMQNMFMHADYIKSQGMFAQYLGETKIPMIDARDIAKAAFNALTTDKFNDQTFVLTGPRAISFYDIAKTMSSTIGRDINYVSLSYEDQREGFKSFGLPDWSVDSVMAVFKTWVDMGMMEPTNDLETITNSKGVDIDEFAKDHAPVFA